jgi:hypothetical protein
VRSVPAGIARVLELDVRLNPLYVPACPFPPTKLGDPVNVTLLELASSAVLSTVVDPGVKGVTEKERSRRSSSSSTVNGENTRIDKFLGDVVVLRSDAEAIDNLRQELRLKKRSDVEKSGAYLWICTLSDIKC